MPAIEAPAAYTPGRAHLRQIETAKNLLDGAEAAQAVAEAKLSDIRISREADLAAGRRPNIDRNRLGGAEDAADAAQRRTAQLRAEYEAVRDAVPNPAKLARAQAEQAKISAALVSLRALLEEAAPLVATCRAANAALYAELRGGGSEFNNNAFAARLSGLCEGVLRAGEHSDGQSFYTDVETVWTKEMVEKIASGMAVDSALRALRLEPAEV